LGSWGEDRVELKKFRITNFRSINDSGDINVEKLTALLGRNESGKSNLLLGLKTLNPVGGYKNLDPIKDFPRHRRLEECNDATRVVETSWSLNDVDRAKLATIAPRASKATTVSIGRNYAGSRWVGFEGLADHEFAEADIKSKTRKIAAAVRAVASNVEEAKKGTLEVAADNFERNASDTANQLGWSGNTKTVAAALRTALAAADSELTDKQETLLVELEELSSTIAGDADAMRKARNWAVEQLPIFMFLEDYPEMSGHQNIAEYLTRKNNNKRTDADLNFEKLCKVAGLDPQKLAELLTKKEQEARNQLANRASAVVTTEIRRLWKDRPLKIRFNLDADFLDTFISDPNAIYDVEVNLDERSRGFKWFFSFYITFAADTDEGAATNAILLLDEPGLYLHAKSQSDLLRHFETDFGNQIIYTTHSPFMVPTNNLDAIRTVNIADGKGTTVTNDPTGDARTLFPLQAALGYDLAQSLFVGPNNLVVEGVTDFWILSSVSDYLIDAQKDGIDPTITLTPAGGAQKVSYMVALLSSENLNVLVLLDEEQASRLTSEQLVQSKLIRDQNIVFVSEVLPTSTNEADIEDLLDASLYEALVRESYAKELKGKTLKLNPKIPRIAKRVEAAFKELGIEFHKTRPTRLLLSKMASDPSKIVTANVEKNFSGLFTIINQRLKKHIERAGEPFR
jgi:predicted ATPase